MTTYRNTPEQILQRLAENNGNFNLTAGEMKVSANHVRELHLINTKRFNATPEGLGPKKLQKYIVATKKVYEDWDNEAPKLSKARQDYDDGKIEMCTGRDGLNLIIYAFPKKKPSMENRPYFSKMGDE